MSTTPGKGTKRAIALVALILLIGSIPPTVARHRSVGYEDEVGVTQDNEPTVPNDAQVDQETEAADTPYEVGTTHPSDCTEIGGNLSEEHINNATTADEYCGELVYNEELDSSLEVVSPPDQDIRHSSIGTFDVVRTDLVGFPGGLTLCTPFCPPGGLTNLPGGDMRHEIFYDTMAQTGLTDNSNDTEDQQRQNRRNYGSAQVAYPNAAGTVQRQTGMWEMNGWANPNAMHTFVAFLEDDDGQTIGPERLKTMMGNTDLPNKAVPKVCGFTEDRTISTTKSDNFCEFELKYYEPEEEQDPSFTEYGDRCKSPTYVCNSVGGPSWRASPPAFLGSVASPAMGIGEDVLVPGLGAGIIFGDGDKFVTWHWVVAPAPQTCSAQEPVVRLQDDQASHPYLAHDLDSYVPSTRLSGADTPSPGSLEAYADEIASGPVDTVFSTVDTVFETVNSVELPDPVEEQVNETQDAVNEQVNDTNQQVDDAQNDTVGDLSKASRQEPNANPGQNPLADTSKSHVSVDQTLDDPCQRALSGQTEETLDPWVDMIDSGTSYTVTETTAYGNTEDHQDDDNNPGPDRISTSGNLGLFADKNDDGDYDTSGDPYRQDNIANVGAYPMLWNVKVDKTGPASAEITSSGSCEFTDTNNTKLSLEAKRLGYGPNTGLFQLIYLQEPTVVDSNLAAVEERIVYGDGNNIFLVASQSVRELMDEDFDDAPSFALEGELDSAVRELKTWVLDNTDVEEEPAVQIPGEEFGLTTDFNHQCLGSTGGFSNQMSFVHDCQTMTCEGDTVITQYVFEVTTDDGRFNEDQTEVVPAFHGTTDSTESFGGFAPLNVWTDVDPLDGNPDRNDQDTQRPPT